MPGAQRQTARARLGAGIGLAAILSVASAAAEAWLTYANDRFGATADYPAVFSVRADPPANGDGQRFFTADRRAELAIYGYYNVENRTPAQLMANAEEDGVRYSYRSASRDAYVLSGTKAERIRYQRCLRSRHERDIFNCVDLTYPADEAKRWDPIVTRISRSLRSGRPG